MALEALAENIKKGEGFAFLVRPGRCNDDFIRVNEKDFHKIGLR